MSKSTSGMFDNAAIINSKLLSGDVVQSFEVAAHSGKDRIVVRDMASGTLAVIYTRDTPTIAAGSGYIVRNSTANSGAELGRELGQRGEKFTFPSRFVTACNKAVSV